MRISEQGEIDMEIIFRGKSISTGEWVYGSLRYSENKTRSFICTPKDKGRDISIEVSPTTVCLMVGKMDVEGKLIFEGDIVLNFETGQWGRIEWDNRICAFILNLVDPQQRIDLSSISTYMVVANIFDMPTIAKTQGE